MKNLKTKKNNPPLISNNYFNKSQKVSHFIATHPQIKTLNKNPSLFFSQPENTLSLSEIPFQRPHSHLSCPTFSRYPFSAPKSNLPSPSTNSDQCSKYLVTSVLEIFGCGLPLTYQASDFNTIFPI